MFLCDEITYAKQYENNVADIMMEGFVSELLCCIKI